MNGIVIIPAFDRPAFLQVCIDHILKADGAETMRYIFALDTGYHPDNLKVINGFPFQYAVLPRKSKVVGIGKQSNNVLMGLLAGLNYCDGKPIYYIEDDVFIGKDFFTFGAKMLEPDTLCAVLSKNVNGNDTVTDDLNAYYTKLSNEYQGIGSIFNPSMLERYIKPHICTEYVLQPRAYCLQHFPKTLLGADYCEQDGLIRRIIEKNGLKVAFSHVPRCFHAGFFGYHRLTAHHVRKLPLKEQVKKIYQIAFNVDELRKVALSENLVYDSMPVNLETNHTDCYETNPRN